VHRGSSLSVAERTQGLTTSVAVRS